MNSTGKLEYGIKIGIIGPDEMIRMISNPVKGFPSFIPEMRAYQREDEAPQLAAELAEHVEVLLFTGIVPYRIAMEKMRFSIPVHYIPLTGTGLYRSLFRLEKKAGLAALSADTISREAVVNTLAELGNNRRISYILKRAAILHAKNCLNFIKNSSGKGNAPPCLLA